MSSPQLTRLRPTLADIMMDDVTPDAFARFDENDPDAADKLRLMLKCREEAPVWAPDKVGDLARKGEKEAAACEVRRRRAVWAVDFKRRYQPEVIEWIDTGHKREKPCAVLLLKPRESRGGPPLIAVAFRGSKTTQDYFITDASPRFVPLPEGATQDADVSAAAFWPLLAGSARPCVTMGAWRAYAGEPERASQPQSSIQELGPRARMRMQVLATDVRLPTSGCTCRRPLPTDWRSRRAHPCSPLPTPAHPCPPLPTPAHPCQTLLTPAQPCSPLPNPAHLCPLLLTPAH